MIKYLIINLLSFVSSFELLDGYHIQIPKKLCPDDNVPYVIRDIIEEQNLITLDCDGNTGNIYIVDETSYSGINQYDHTNVYISHKYLLYPNTLYNVILHESLHARGLNHSSEQGMMNYYVSLDDSTGYVINDNHRYWLSQDDIQGLNYIYNSLF